MTRIELIYDATCPNVEAARTNLRSALAEAGQPPVWQEWERSEASSPAHARRYGSPTILIDGEDVTGAAPSDGADCCRVYPSPEGGLQGAPPVEFIAASLRSRATRDRTSAGLRSWLAILPGVGVALLPKLACPACWPAYAGLLGAVGLGFLTRTTCLLPLTAAFLAIAVGALCFRARSRRGYGPFAIGLAAAAVVLIGKFGLESDSLMYGGIALLIGASAWNTWPRREQTPSCPACAGAASQSMTSHSSDGGLPDVQKESRDLQRRMSGL